MAFSYANASRIVVDGTHATAFLKSADMTQSVEMVDVTTLIDSVKQNLTGQGTGKVTLKGLYDPVPELAFTTALTTPGTDKVVQYAPSGFAIGSQVYACAAVMTEFSIGAATADALSADLTFIADGFLDDSIALHDISAETASANSTSFDAGAATTNGGVGYLNVVAASGTTPSIVVKVQHSTNNSTWVDLVTFTAATTTSAQRISVSGTVNRYLRTLWTVTGTTPSLTFTASFARR